MKFAGLFLVSILPLAAFADGNCVYRAYTECTGHPLRSHLATRLTCLISGSTIDGVFTTASYKECKTEAKHFGQYVAIRFFDFSTKKTTAGEVYQE